MNLQQVAPTIHPNDGNLMQSSQLQQLGHSLGFGAYHYDPYYGGVMAAYGQPWVCASLGNDVDSCKDATRDDTRDHLSKSEAVPWYYAETSAKAEVEKKLIKERKPYLRESHHLHAMRRERGSGGRFVKKSNTDASRGTESTGSSGSKPLLSGTSEEKPEEGTNSRHLGDL